MENVARRKSSAVEHNLLLSCVSILLCMWILSVEYKEWNSGAVNYCQLPVFSSWVQAVKE